MIVNFLIVGVQKAATTTLREYLSEHAQIYMAFDKVLDWPELHFFDNEIDINWSKPDYSVYHRHFLESSTGQVLGETTPIYCYWPSCMARIKQYNPEMRIIVIFRNPIERAYSHWKMEVARQKEALSFSLAIRDGRERTAANDKPDDRYHRTYSYVERGMYAAQIQRILQYFPRQQILFMTTDQLIANTNELLDTVCEFLGVATFADYPHVRIVRQIKPCDDLGSMSVGDRYYLKALYSQDINHTAELTGLDLKGWL